MSEYEISLTLEFSDNIKASEIVDLIQKAKKYLDTIGDGALHDYLHKIDRTHDIDFDSWWMPVSVQLNDKQVTLKMIGSPSGAIEQDIITWLKVEGGVNIKGNMIGDDFNESVGAIDNSEQEEIQNDIELREDLYGPTKSGDLARLKDLLSKIKNINAIEPWTGHTALMLASSNGHLEMVEYLISKGADVNFASKKKKATALTYAVRNGHAPIVETLIKNGASTKYLDAEQKKAFGVS